MSSGISDTSSNVLKFDEFRASKSKANLESPTPSSSFRIAREDESERTWLSIVLKNLQQIADQKQNWDSYGARAPSTQTIAFSYKLLASLWTAKLPIPTILPTSAESVVFEWASGTKELSLEVFAPFAAQYYFRENDAEEEGSIEDSLEPIGPLIDRLIGEPELKQRA